MQPRRLIKILLTLSSLLLAIMTTNTASAAQNYIGLRSGPAPAFPIVFEVTEFRELRPVSRRGSWLLVTDERNRGWIHVDDIHKIRSFPRDEMWKLINDARPGDTRLEFGLSSDEAYSFSVIGPVFSEKLYAAYTRGPEGLTSWSKLEAGVTREFGEIQDDIRLHWRAGLGYGMEGTDSTHWRLVDDEPVWLGAGGVEAVWQVERYFEIGLRGDVSVTLDADTTTHTTATLVWRIRI
jgi:hypothetical protein